MVNSVGSFLFDSIKPMILKEVKNTLTGEINTQARNIPQQFPNSITPVDAIFATGRYPYGSYYCKYLAGL